MKLVLKLFLTFMILCWSVTSAFAVLLEKPRRPSAILYKVKVSATQEQKGALQNLLWSYQVQPIRNIEKLSIKLIKLEKGDKTEEEVSLELIATGAVEFAEPDYLVAPAYIPDDPWITEQWHHEKINSYQAWDSIQGDASVLVAVCDTGVDSSHPDLSANLQLPGYNSVDGSTDTEPIIPHGTGVAGCISAVGDNGIGVAGVGWNVRMLPVRVTNRDDGWAYYSDMAEGVQWAADQGAHVINLRLGRG